MATATKDKKATETTNRCDASKVKIGSVWSRHSYGTVVARRGEEYTLRDETGFEWDVRGSNILENQFSFADQHEQELKVTRTELNQVIMDNRGIAMTVCFKKTPKHNEVAKELAAGQGTMSDRAWSKHVKELIEGHERVMIGHHGGVVDEHQRLKFTETGVGQRLVTMTHTQWVIVDRTKYVVKTK